MLDSFFAAVSFTNPHPLVVHFPIALLLTATLFDLGCLVLRRRRWLDPAAATLYVLGTAGAGVAWWTGGRAAADLASLSGAAQAALADHGSLGLLTLLAFLAVTALRIVIVHLGRADEKVQIGFFRLLALVAALAAQTALVSTAEHGGALVYRHGVGVETTERPAP